MFHILGFIFFFVLIILSIGFVILWRIVNTFLGMGKRMTGQNSGSQNAQQQTYQNAQNESAGNNSSTSQTTSGRSEKKKVFDNDEGEYVEFEEIKD